MRPIYDGIKIVFCPILNENITFNARGYYHLQHDIHGNGRDPKTRIHKLSLIPLTVPVIKIATSVDEEREEWVQLERKKGAKKVRVRYIALVADVGKKSNVRVRVVLIRPEGSQKTIFWSAMRLKITKKAP
ncbi:MAG: hypothetical protein Q7S26_02950 [bacterium]|nr:hypothetical protein [bacterium]